MEARSISPEAVALLSEVSVNPELAVQRLASYALRPKASRKQRALPERELVELFRFEAALILAREAQRRQYEDPYWQGLLHVSLRAGETLKISTRVEAEEAVLLVRKARNDVAGERGLLSMGLDTARSAFDLARASFRVMDTDFCSMLLAMEYMRRNEWESCQRSIARAFELASFSLYRSIAWEHLGGVMTQRGRLDDAIDAYARAAELETDRPFPLFFASLLCSATGKLDRAHDFARRGEELVEEDDASIPSCVSAFRVSSKKGVLPPSLGKDRSRIVAGPATKKIYDALL